ncbi:MAG: M20/M25/M40 family metallo-hydrolase, partial [Chitinophagales bacterium]|nr:M20/M25/M40 family metallo-hydrolase [Chitinophagales bacterium]
MKKLLIVSSMFCMSVSLSAQTNDSIIMRQIFDETMNNGEAYDWLYDLCKNVGHRLSGSPQADMAVRWAEATMKEAGFDKVWLQEVMVPHWVRGQKEYGEIMGVGQVEILALGGSIATPEEGIIERVIEVQSFDELKKIGKEKVKGKIVFFNAVFPQDVTNSFDGYGICGPYRWYGPDSASAYGAIASITRSVSSAHDEFPHTGSTGFRSGNPAIPCVAISTIDADKLHSALQKNADTKFKMVLDCRMLGEKKSYNVIGEITGTEFPNEIIVVGGHLDSWDVGEGAHDDGAGCVHSMEVIRTLKALNIKPKRTIRCVLYMNEENGVMGGNGYADWAKTTDEKHLYALESDAGGFSPRGFSIDTDNKSAITNFAKLVSLFEEYGVTDFEEGYSGVDIRPLKVSGTICFGFRPDSQRYMDLHHTANDTFDKVNKRELHMGAAAMAMFCWWLSEYG